ncbi:MAG: hypothetical protein ACFFE8_10375 [Candidatus Heimdallarchaeota archaeon]
MFNGSANMKHENKLQRGFLLWVIVSVIVVLSSSTSILAAPLSTTTTLLSDTGVVGTSEPPVFTVIVYAGVDPVPTGSVLITHLNSTQTDVISLVSGSITSTWPWSLSTPGTHIFRADFQGFPGYQTSSGTCKVFVEDITPGTQQSPFLDLDANSTVAHKNGTVSFTLTLSILENWYFEGGYLSVTNQNLSGTPTIYTYGPLPFYYPDSNPTVLTHSFSYPIPEFSPVGLNYFIANYTGSGLSGTAPAFSSWFGVQIEGDGFSLVQRVNQTTIQRNAETSEFNITVVGDYPVGLPLESYYFRGGKRITINQIILTSRDVMFTFSPNSSVTLGLLTIFTVLTDASGSNIYDNISQGLVIVDNARIDPTTNSSIYRHNETIKFSVYVTEEDVWTRPVFGDVELIDVTDGYRSLENRTLDINGFVIFTSQIPSNATVGFHKYGLRTFNTPSDILDQQVEVMVTIKGITTIDLDYGTGIVDRATTTTITATVLSGGVALIEGQIVLEFSNGTAIETKNAAPGLDFYFYIEPNHVLGVSKYQIHYLGSLNYDAHVEIFNLSIISNPTFNATGQNASEVVKGHTLRIWGELLDEIGNPVYFEEVSLTDTTSGVFLGTAQTDANGIFISDYFISRSTQIGLHFVEVSYTGNIPRFYRGATNTPILSFTVRPPLSVMIATEVVANNWTIITLEGGLNDLIDLSWQKNGEPSWFVIGTTQLNGFGQGTFNWSTPYYKGGFTIRAQGPSDTKYDSSTMWVISDLTVIGSGIGSVNDPYYFTVNSSERYQIWIEGILWQNWVGGGGGPTPYSHTFTSRGSKNIMVRCNDTYVYLRETQNLIAVYEEVAVSLTSPATTTINVTVHLDGLVLGEITGPLTAHDAVLYVNGTSSVVDVTNGAGRYDFYIQFNQPGMYALQVQAPSSGYFQEALSPMMYLEVKPEPPVVNILSPAHTTTVGGIFPVFLDGNAQNYLYFIDTVDSDNVTWDKTVYRSLVEGSYTLHAYGVNQWGLMTHVFADFTVDTTAPSLGIISPINTSYVSSDVQFSFLTDGTQVSVWLDGNTVPSPYPSIFQSLSEGSHLLKITVEDMVSNNITQQVSFSIDTIPPILQIDTPFNQSYIGDFNLSISSDGATILYFISGLHTTNQTYTLPMAYNLTVGQYQLTAYAFDEAGNNVHQTVDFSIVPSADLLIDPRLVEVDGAGSYNVQTLLQNNPDFESVGVWRNGSYVGDLQWDFFTQNYTLDFQLPFPGIWGITLYARTTLGEYDMRHFTVTWYPPAPTVASFDFTWQSVYYEAQVEVDTIGLPIDQVTIEINGQNYPLTYQAIWNRYEGQIHIMPQNLSIILMVWYPWDLGSPSHSSTYYTSWFAPNIFIDNYAKARQNFTLTILVNKENASIDTSAVYLELINDESALNVTGVLIYESIGSTTQRWIFRSPLLARTLWNYSLVISDIHGAQRIILGTFNATDSPPVIGNSTIQQANFQEDGGNVQVTVDVTDDYQVTAVFLEVNGDQYPSHRSGQTYTFTVWLDIGTYSFRIVATDDIGQEQVRVIGPFTVEGESEVNSTNANPSSGSNQSSVPFNDELFPQIVIGAIVLVVMISTGNLVINRRKEGSL